MIPYKCWHIECIVLKFAIFSIIHFLKVEKYMDLNDILITNIFYERQVLLIALIEIIKEKERKDFNQRLHA